MVGDIGIGLRCSGLCIHGSCFSEGARIQIYGRRLSLTTLIIIGVASLASLFLIIFGAVTGQSGVLATGTGILGALLGAAGIKYQPQIGAFLERHK